MTGEKCATDHIVDANKMVPAPAEMPGIYRIADEFERELFAWRNLPSRDGAALRACAYALAQKAETLFAPILAENRYENSRLAERALTAELGFAKERTRALAAEAAMAAERERADMAVRQMIKQNDRIIFGIGTDRVITAGDLRRARAVAALQIAAPSAAMEAS